MAKLSYWFVCVAQVLTSYNFVAALLYEPEADEFSRNAIEHERFWSKPQSQWLHHARRNPEAKMDVIQVLAYHGYPGERHEVTTKDGYIIEMHRIPHGKNAANSTRPAVLVTHCLVCSSDVWVANLPNQSLGFILADQGYDVWLGNIRGNTYGRKHVSLSINSVEFWRFSWDHHALFDLPAQVDHILAATGQEQILFVGHSQGAMSGFAGVSTNATLRSKIKAFAGLAPVAYIGNLKAPLMLFLEQHSRTLLWLMKILRMKEFLPNSWVIRALVNRLCEKFHVGAEICENGMFLIAGFDKNELNTTRLDVYFDHTPAGTSVQNMVHYAQGMRSGQFQMFDYGTLRENMKYYGQAAPPFYWLDNVTIPVAIYKASGDWFATPPDVALLKQDLPNCVVDFTVSLETFSHIDFIWAVEAKSYVYDELLKFLDQYR